MQCPFSQPHRIKAPSAATVVGARARPAVTFGLEIELSLEHNPRMLLDYMPALGTETEWLSFDDDRRMQLAREWNRVSAGTFYKRATFDKLSVAPSILPTGLQTEGPTGKLEINSPPFGSLEEAARFLYFCESRYGPGQIQGHVVIDARPLPGFSGYAVFESDHALLRNLVEADGLFRRGTCPPQMIFSSRFLIPLSNATRDALEASARELKDIERAQDRIPVAAPVVRSGIVYRNTRLVGIEMRQWDTPSGEGAPCTGRSEQLVLSLNFLAGFIGARHPFEPFAAFRALDLDARQELESTFPRNSHDAIRSCFSSLAQARRCEEDTIWMLLSTPLRRWENYPLLTYSSASTRERILRHLARARESYVTTVQEISLGMAFSADERSPRTEDELGPWEPVKKLHAAVARFTAESSLLEMYDDAVFDSLADSARKTDSEDVSDRTMLQGEIR